MSTFQETRSGFALGSSSAIYNASDAYTFCKNATRLRHLVESTAHGPAPCTYDENYHGNDFFNKL
jgi:hypothetical protein